MALDHALGQPVLFTHFYWWGRNVFCAWTASWLPYTTFFLSVSTVTSALSFSWSHRINKSQWHHMSLTTAAFLNFKCSQVLPDPTATSLSPCYMVAGSYLDLCTLSQQVSLPTMCLTVHSLIWCQTLPLMDVPKSHAPQCGATSHCHNAHCHVNIGITVQRPMVTDTSSSCNMASRNLVSNVINLHKEWWHQCTVQHNMAYTQKASVNI